MLRLHQIFLSYFLLIIIVLFVFFSFLSYYGIKNIEINNFKNYLRKSILLVEENLKTNDDFVRHIDKKVKIRITVIDKSGKVLAESRYNKYKMENHSNRPEIRDAFEKGWGESIRYSKTLKKDFLYMAKRIRGEKVLRMAYPLDDIKKHFYSLWIKFLVIFIMFIILSLMVSYILSNQIKKEISAIVDYVKSIADKNYTHTIEIGFTKEFDIISKNLGNLAKRLKKRDSIKNKFTRKIKRMNKERNELISAIGHEFKNPIAIISGYVQTLLEEDLSPSLRKSFLTKIYNASEKISYMIDRLSLAIKFDSGGISPKKEEFDICDVVEESINFLKSKYRNRNIFFRCQDNFLVYADRKMMDAVVSNLIDNALKYSESDISVEISNGEFAVEDKGIGVKKEDIDKITKKFYRVEKSWDNSMGLGLYIVKYILKLHDVKLEIDSVYGKGSRFYFKLPQKKG